MLEPNFFFCKNGDKKSIFIVKIPLIAPTLGGGGRSYSYAYSATGLKSGFFVFWAL